MRTVDVCLFMGQSNMAGRGDASLAPPVAKEEGYEYKAISAPDRLCEIREPFGSEENRQGGVYEPGMKTGSLVSAFVTACYEKTGVQIVAVSCSKGGSSIREWQEGTDYDRDARNRYHAALSYLSNHDYRVRTVSLVWCQGCTDGDQGMSGEEYERLTKLVFEQWLSLGVNHIFLIRIGNHRDNPSLYVPMQQAQERLAESMEKVVMVSRQFAVFAAMGLMKDTYHYKQEGYNMVGSEAGAAAGECLKNLW